MAQKNYDFARYVLPITETEIKEQKHLAKQSLTDENVVLSEAAFLSSSTTLASDDPVGGDRIASQANGTSKLVISTEGREFHSKILAEFRTIAAFKNNLGVPNGDLKLLDGDALEQLDSALSIDDQ